MSLRSPREQEAYEAQLEYRDGCLERQRANLAAHGEEPDFDEGFRRGWAARDGLRFNRPYYDSLKQQVAP